MNANIRNLFSNFSPSISLPQPVINNFDELAILANASDEDILASLKPIQFSINPTLTPPNPTFHKGDFARFFEPFIKGTSHDSKSISQFFAKLKDGYKQRVKELETAEKAFRRFAEFIRDNLNNLPKLTNQEDIRAKINKLLAPANQS